MKIDTALLVITCLWIAFAIFNMFVSSSWWQSILWFASLLWVTCNYTHYITKTSMRQKQVAVLQIDRDQVITQLIDSGKLTIEHDGKELSWNEYQKFRDDNS